MGVIIGIIVGVLWGLSLFIVAVREFNRGWAVGFAEGIGIGYIAAEDPDAAEALAGNAPEAKEAIKEAEEVTREFMAL